MKKTASDIVKKLFQTFSSSKVGKQLSTGIPKSTLNTMMAPVTATACAISDSCIPLDSTELNILWVGNTSPIKLDGGRWMGALKCLLGITGDLTLRIANPALDGLVSPYEGFSSTVPDLSILCMKDIEASKAALPTASIVILSQPDFVNLGTDDKQLLKLAIEKDKPVYGFFWSEFDLLSEQITCVTQDFNICTGIKNPVQVGCDSATAECIASQIARIEDYQGDQVDRNMNEFMGYMRNLSGNEGFSQQQFLPGTKVKNLMINKGYINHDFYFLIDNYIIDRTTRYIFLQDTINNSINAITQVHVRWIDYLDSPEPKNLLDALTWAYKIKALYLYDSRVANLKESEPTLGYMKDCYQNSNGPMEARVLGARVLHEEGDLYDCTELNAIFENGIIEPGLILAVIANNNGNTDTSVISRMANSGFGEYSFHLAAAQNPEMENETTEMLLTAVQNYSPQALYCVGLEKVDQGCIAEGLDMMGHAVFLGDNEASENLPLIIAYLKDHGNKQDIPKHHLVYKNTERKLEIVSNKNPLAT